MDRIFLARVNSIGTWQAHPHFSVEWSFLVICMCKKTRVTIWYFLNQTQQFLGTGIPTLKIVTLEYNTLTREFKFVKKILGRNLSFKDMLFSRYLLVWTFMFLFAIRIRIIFWEQCNMQLMICMGFYCIVPLKIIAKCYLTFWLIINH